MRCSDFQSGKIFNIGGEHSGAQGNTLKFYLEVGTYKLEDAQIVTYALLISSNVLRISKKLIQDLASDCVLNILLTGDAIEDFTGGASQNATMP